MHVHISAVGAKAGGLLVRAGLLGMLLSPIPVMSADTALADSLAQSLEAQGWQASKDSDGNTLYTREKTSDESANTSDNAALKKALEAKGWKVEWDADNNMILRPPAKPGEAKPAAETTTNASVTEAAPEAPDTALADSLAQSLEAQGWQASKDSEGNTLYTREKVSDKSANASDNTALKKALEAKGWKVEWDADNNMILRPPAKPGEAKPAAKTTKAPVTEAAPEAPDTALADSLAQSLEAQGWHARRDSKGNTIYTRVRPRAGTPRGSRNAALKKALEDKGWKVHWDDNDNLILRPPTGRKSTSSVVRASTNAPPPAIPNVPGMEYWTIERLSDGSLAFHPKAKPAGNSNPLARLPGSCPASRYTVSGVKPPVNTWSKAKAIGEAWLADAGMVETAIPGRIRKVLRVYLVSIVTRHAPHRLLHQIAIRSADGGVVVLD